MTTERPMRAAGDTSRHAMPSYRSDTIIIHLLTLYVIALAYIAMYALAYEILPFTYGDERYYIRAGVKYVEGAPLTEYNPEHPPLAKYLIGLSAIYLHNPHVVTFMAGLASSFLIYFIILRISGSAVNSFLGALLALLEVPFLKIFRYALLDSIAMPFILAAFYVTMFNVREPGYRRLAIEGILWGLATACKWPSLYFLLASLIIKLMVARGGNATSETMRRRAPNLISQYALVLTTAFATYSVTFLRDIIESPQVFIRHNLFMISYMYRMHSVIINTIVSALTMMLLKTTFWHILPSVYITLKMTHGVVISTYTRVMPPHHRVEIDILPTFGALLMPAISLLLPYGAMTYRRMNSECRAAFITAILSLLPAFHGNIPWYYAYPVAFWSIFAASALKSKYLTTLILADIAYYTIACLAGLTHPIVLRAG